MTWRPEPAAATWLQAALFGCAALGFGLTSLAGSGRVRRPGLPALLHALMAGTMIWMLAAMPAMTGMTSPGSARGAMAPMPRIATPVPVLVVSIFLLASAIAKEDASRIGATQITRPRVAFRPCPPAREPRHIAREGTQAVAMLDNGA